MTKLRRKIIKQTLTYIHLKQIGKNKLSMNSFIKGQENLYNMFNRMLFDSRSSHIVIKAVSSKTEEEAD